jgi:hypothetical protein
MQLKWRLSGPFLTIRQGMSYEKVCGLESGLVLCKERQTATYFVAKNRVVSESSL